MNPAFEPERLYPLPMPLRKYAQMACQHSASDTDIQRFSLYARNTSWKSVLPVYWQLLDPGRIPPAASLEDALAPEWPHSARLTAALGAIKTLLLHLQQRDPRPARASTSSVEYALWNRLFPWMCFFQQYDPALPLGCRASPELGIFLPFLHFTVAVFQPVGRELNDLYSRAPGLAKLVFHIWSLIVEDRGKEDELGYHALTVLLPQELTPAVASEAIEGVGGTLEDVATLISKHIRVFAPRISRRVRGAEMLLPNGIHLGVFQTVLKTARAFSTYDLRVQRSLPADSEHHVTRSSEKYLPARRSSRRRTAHGMRHSTKPSHSSQPL
ncbi:hypothetical protein C8F01DRAFT_671788 [Mycena amicta]|nr:hypothetical protein C8F01DRAFT_671788 [Mycena amicta]